MTLRELLNETVYQEINYLSGNKENSVVSGKAIEGFPGNRERFPISDNYIFNVVRLDDGSYEFYVGDQKATKGMPYRHKKYYVGTLKDFTEFKDAAGVAMECIRRFINSNRLGDKERKYLLDYYNNARKHPYYGKYFGELTLREEEHDI